MPGMLMSMDSVHTGEELHRRALGVAEALVEHGVSPGDRVVLKAGNSPGFVAVLLGLVHVGASVVMLDHDQRSQESALIAGQARARLTVVDDQAMPVPGPPAVSIYELLHAATGRVRADGVIDTCRWAEQPDALILFSSGSTGMPKGIVKSGCATLENLRRTISRMGYGPDDVLLPLLPFSHQYGLSLVLIALLSGSALTVAPHCRLDRSMWMAARTGTTIVDATPAGYRSMLNLLAQRPTILEQLDDVRMFCVGGAPLDSALALEFEGRLGRRLLDGYGSTELGNVSFATPGDPQGCGKVLDGLDLLVSSDGATPLPPGEIGQISVRSPDAFTGYLRADGSVATQAGEWCHTGDLGSLSATGHLEVVGRRSAVHRMGYTLHPEVIERRAAACGASVWIVPLPDERLGNRLVFLVEDAADRPPAYWRDRLCTVLAPFEQPNRVLVIDSVPLGRTGKPDRAQLAELATAATPGLAPGPGAVHV